MISELWIRLEAYTQGYLAVLMLSKGLGWKPILWVGKCASICLRTTTATPYIWLEASTSTVLCRPYFDGVGCRLEIGHTPYPKLCRPYYEFVLKSILTCEAWNLYLHAVWPFKYDVVYEFVVGQRIPWVDSDATEYLIVDVGNELLHEYSNLPYLTKCGHVGSPSCGAYPNPS